MDKLLKKIIDEIWMFLYVHLYASPIALVSFGFVALMIAIFWVIMPVMYKKYRGTCTYRLRLCIFFEEPFGFGKIQDREQNTLFSDCGIFQNFLQQW